MTRGDKHVGSRKPHILFSNGLWRCYTLVWEKQGLHTIGIRLGLGRTPGLAHICWMDDPRFDSGRLVYTMKL